MRDTPYSPKIKYLREESEARLSNVVQFAHDIATFRLEVTSKPGARSLQIRPGQAIVLDFMEWIGPPQYLYMADEAPGSINDDRICTWTVSSAHEGEEVTWFESTMREMSGGTVRGTLFDICR